MTNKSIRIKTKQRKKISFIIYSYEFKFLISVEKQISSAKFIIMITISILLSFF